MKFIKGFYVYSSGMIEETWLNLSLIKSFRHTDYYNNKLGKTINGVLKCDMGAESSDKVPYINPQEKSFEIRTIEEIFEFNSENQQARKRGRKEADSQTLVLKSSYVAWIQLILALAVGAGSYLAWSDNKYVPKELYTAEINNLKQMMQEQSRTLHDIYDILLEKD